MKYILIVLTIILALNKAAIVEHLVTGLNEQTGYTKPWYSGYLDVSTQGQNYKSHYFFFPSQNKPESDPVLLWLNGGPGCSSLLGASQENGPWVFEEDSTKIKLNPWSWNKEANVIYLESPPGVGYSTTTDYSWDDQKTALINLDSLVQFFKSYEEYRNLDFYISGESYAGIYIPTLSEQILKHNKQVEKSEQINLKGFLAGNACTSVLECNTLTVVVPYMWEMFATQGFFSPKQISAYNRDCGSLQDPSIEQLNTIECIATSQSQLLVASYGLNLYNLLGTCYHQDIPSYGQNTWTPEVNKKVLSLLQNNPELVERSGVSYEQIEEIISLHGVNGDIPRCTDGIGPMTFFNDDYVKQQLHVDANIRWTLCSDEISHNYSNSRTGTYDLYPSLIEAGLKIWIYSGDVDGAVSSGGTFQWVEKLNKQEQYDTKMGWRAWYCEGELYGPQLGNRQNAGQVMESEGLTLVTFKGCGHMVPTDNPVGAAQMLKSYFSGESLPPY